MSCEIETTRPLAQMSPCERLALVEDALFAIAAGTRAVRVRHGNNFIEYSLGSVAFLERERARLSALCAASTGGGRRGITLSTVDRVARPRHERWR